MTTGSAQFQVGPEHNRGTVAGGKTLGCGCVPGRFQCPEYAASWAEVNRAYATASRLVYLDTLRTHEEFSRRHLREQPKGCGDDAVNCAACFMDLHGTHDVATRHENGQLATATCHDCGAVYPR